MNLFLEDLKIMFNRELNSYKKEIRFFLNEDSLWEKPEGITNSAGNIVLHICGNLNHFVGAVLGNTGYVREREKEFSTTGKSSSELLLLLEKTQKTVLKTIDNIDEDSLSEIYPLVVGDSTFTVGRFLMHLETHLAFHLGQLGYLRRIINKDERSTNPVSVGVLNINDERK